MFCMFCHHIVQLFLISNQQINILTHILSLLQWKEQETREQQQILAKEREINAQQTRARDRALQEQESQAKDRSNRNVVIKHERNAKHAADMIKHEEQTYEKRSSIEKMKASIVYKKNMFKAGQTQHVVTKQVLTETNPYAQRMNDEIHAKTLAARMKTTMGGVSGSGK